MFLRARCARTGSIRRAVMGAALVLSIGVGSESSSAQPHSGSFVGVLKARLSASDAAPNDVFGSSVALSGDTAIVGAVGNDDNGADSGAAYVFVQSDGAWAEEQKILASDGTAGDHFGASVAVSGNTAVVGAKGAAYVLVRSGGGWLEQQKLVRTNGDPFGDLEVPVAISGDTVLVAGPGSAFVFMRSGDGWAQKQELVANGGQEIGGSVSLWESTAIVGANESAFVFVRSGGVWVQQQKLLAEKAPGPGYFSHSVAVRADTAFVSAPWEYTEEEGHQQFGAVHVFVRKGGHWSWTQRVAISYSERYPVQGFGDSIALGSDLALLGAWTPAPLILARDGGVWAEQSLLVGSSGSAVALSGMTALAGYPGDDGAGTLSGSASVLRLALSDGSDCTTGTECASGLCSDGVCGTAVASEPSGCACRTAAPSPSGPWCGALSLLGLGLLAGGRRLRRSSGDSRRRRQGM